MARLESQGKMGFYPTPEDTLWYIRKFLTIKSYTSILDPCCGEGVAIHKIAYYDAATWGVELDADRVVKATSWVNHAIQGNIFDVRINPLGSMGLLYLNPPYDSVDGKRMEYEFLKHSSKWLITGGVLTYIVPEYVMGKDLCEWIGQYFEKISVYRFSATDYPKFKQIVLFGYKREQRAKKGENISMENLPYINDVYHKSKFSTYTVPVAPGPTVFQAGMTINEDDIKDNTVRVLEEIRRLAGLEDRFVSCQPILPVRNGHRVSLITNGLLDGRIENPDGSFILLRGFSGRTTATREEDDKEVSREAYSVGIRVMESSGRWYDVV